MPTISPPTLYRQLSPTAARALGEILEVDYPETMPNRFEP